MFKLDLAGPVDPPPFTTVGGVEGAVGFEEMFKIRGTPHDALGQADGSFAEVER
jgi:hypothetical protein